MSTIAAVLGTDSWRPRPADIERMIDRGRYPASLPSRAVVEERCALGAAILPLTREDTLDEQPVQLAGLRVGFAGRLDNRPELCAALGCDDDLSDARLAGLAYQRWDVD